MPVTNHPKGTPLPDGHPFKGTVIVVGGSKPAGARTSDLPAARPAAPAPDDAQPRAPGERVFGICAETNDGGSSYYWIELCPDGYHLMNVEMGHCGGPFEDPVQALMWEGTEYGGNYIDLTCTLPPVEFAELIDRIDVSGASVTVNGVQVEADFVHLMNAYITHYKPKPADVDDQMQQMSRQKSMPMRE